MSVDPIAGGLRVAGILDALGIRYAIGDSVASSIHGEPRATEDVDVLADLDMGRLDAFADALGSEFYIDREAAAEAIRLRTSFNQIYVAAPEDLSRHGSLCV